MQVRAFLLSSISKKASSRVGMYARERESRGELINCGKYMCDRAGGGDMADYKLNYKFEK